MRRIGLFIFIILTFAASLAHADAPIARAALSPSGHHLAIETRVNNTPALAIFDNNDADAAPRLFNMADRGVTKITWADENHVLIVTTERGPGAISASRREEMRGVRWRRGGRDLSFDEFDDLEFSNVYALDIRTMRAVQLLRSGHRLALTLNMDDVAALGDGFVLMRAPVWMDEGSRRQAYVVGPSHYFAPPVIDYADVAERLVARSAVWRVDLTTGEGRNIAAPDEDTGAWIVGASAPIEIEEVGPSFRIRRNQAEPVSIDITGAASIYPLGVRADSDTLEAVVMFDNAPWLLREINLDTGAVTPLGTAPEGVTLQSLIRDERTGLVDGWRDVAGTIEWLDPERRDLTRQLTAAFGGAPVEIVSSSADNIRHVLLVRGSDGGQYYLFDAGRAHAELLGPATP